MTLALKQQLVTDSKNTGGLGNPADFITVHETANEKAGAGAQAHANLQTNGNVRLASWHWSVDDKIAIQSFTHDTVCFHAGDGRGSGNYRSVGIEICVNSDSDFKTAVQNAAHLVKRIMKQEGLPLTRVVQHNHWSGKNCPTFIRSGRDGITWVKFLAMVAASDGEGNFADLPSVGGGGDTSSNIAEDGYWGKATTKRLQEVLGTPADGEVWYQNRAWQKSNPGLTTGWQWGTVLKGSTVIRAMQSKLGVKADGLIGPDTIKALQKRMGTPVDGELWEKSACIIALQKRLNKGTF